ncbi:MAG: hypothetical protein WC797_00775 [Candidatus Paceibacterota bacterium]|jgi:hypothetical protein
MSEKTDWRVATDWNLIALSFGGLNGALLGVAIYRSLVPQIIAGVAVALVAAFLARWVDRGLKYDLTWFAFSLFQAISFGGYIPFSMHHAHLLTYSESIARMLILTVGAFLVTFSIGRLFSMLTVDCPILLGERIRKDAAKTHSSK